MIIEAPSLKEGNGKELWRLHDTVQQHLRALKAMDCEAPGPFTTSILEPKLDSNTMFEWQKHSQESSSVPHYNELLDFINLRAQASESLPVVQKGYNPSFNKKQSFLHKPIASFTANASNTSPKCKTERHPLYACPRFKILPHDQKIGTLKANGICMNCLRAGHFVKQCKSLHHCKTCQKPHHTLLHIDNTHASSTPSSTLPEPEPKAPLIPSNTASSLGQSSLLMTCMILVEAQDGSNVKARALLDSTSSSSFISERLVNGLCLPRFHQNTTISGIAGLARSSLQALTNLTILSPQTGNKFNLTAIVVPRVTCALPVRPISFCSNRNHLNDIPLADPDFGLPGRVDLLLGVDIFTEVLLHCRRTGPPGTPAAFETVFEWVLAGQTSQPTPESFITSHHTFVTTGDDLLRRFWEIEEDTKHESNLSPEEKSVVQHFEMTHRQNTDGRFIVPLSKKPHAPSLGESRSHDSYRLSVACMQKMNLKNSIR